MFRLSLRQQLILPFVLGVIFVSAAIGWLSYRASDTAIKALAERVLTDMVNRINHATDEQLRGAVTTLNSLAPDPKTVPKEQPFSDDIMSLEKRLWAASGLFMQVSNYVYFGGEDGRFVGVNRVNRDFVELYLRNPTDKKRHVYSVSAPGDRVHLLRIDNYDPRLRPWYTVAASQSQPVWSAVYNDFTSKEPTITLAKSVRDAGQKQIGVVATDVTLSVLTDFLRSLSISKNGVAFVVDAEGMIVASSGKESPFKMVGDKPERVRADRMETLLIRESYAAIRQWRQNKVAQKTPFTHQIPSLSGTVSVAAAALGESTDLDWVTVVAAPQSDFMGGITRSLYDSIIIACVCVMLALIFGLRKFNQVLTDVRKLTDATKKIGNGELFQPLSINRHDEIGQLARTVNEMEHNLRIDQLTNVYNREFLLAQIRFLMHQAAIEGYSNTGFTLLFIDLDDFKLVNDRYGHDVGDELLIALASRLKTATRSSDVVARYGGDEFVVLLRYIDSPDAAIDIEEKIRTAVENTIRISDLKIRIGISVGWAIFPVDSKDIGTLFKIADTRMFESKKDRKRCAELIKTNKSDKLT